LEMPVRLGRDPRIAVAEDSLHGARVHARHHEKAGGRMAEVVETDLADLGLGPELHAVARTAPELVVRRELRVATRLLAADVLPALDNARMREGTPQHVLQRRMAAQHSSLRVWEEQLGGGSLHRVPEVGHQLQRDRNRLRPTALGRVAIVGAVDDDEAAREVDVALPEP